MTEAIDGPALLLWGGVNEQGELVLKPAFVVDAKSAVVPTSGPYSLTGRDGDGRTPFSVSFDMDGGPRSIDSETPFTAHVT